MYYYIRETKDGQKLTTSYAQESMARRVSGMEKNSSKKKFWEGEMYFDTKTGEFGEKASGVSLRAYMKSEGNDGSGGRFAIFSIVDGKPNDLGVRFKDFGPANTFMKAIAGVYGELFVLEMEKKGVGTVESDDDIEFSTEAPF